LEKVLFFISSNPENLPYCVAWGVTAINVETHLQAISEYDALASENCRRRTDWNGGDASAGYNSSEDLPNQEKNQYWTIYWWGSEALYTKIQAGSDQGDRIKVIRSRNIGPLGRG